MSNHDAAYLALAISTAEFQRALQRLVDDAVRSMAALPPVSFGFASVDEVLYGQDPAAPLRVVMHGD